MIPVSQTLQSLAGPLEGVLQGPDASFSRVSTDTRTLAQGDLYLALRGEHFDGNAFTADAEARGAAGAIVETVDASLSLGQLQVPDAHRALVRMAEMSRERSGARFLAVTGSQGKTTVKEMTGAICRLRAPTLVTRGNRNNAIGVPLTLLELREDDEYAVIELGASAVGEIAETVAMARPHVAAITNAAATHVEGFGSLDGVIRGKGEIIDGLGAEGVAVLNADDPALSRWRRRAEGRTVITFGIDSTACDVSALAIRSAEGARTHFRLLLPDAERDVVLALPGRHNVANALAAAALCHAAGIDADCIVRGLESVNPVAGRLAPAQATSGCLVLDDSYNSSPSSFRAAVAVLMEQAEQSGRTPVVITGVMAELGAEATGEHCDAGRHAREQGVTMLWACGTHREDWCRGFGADARAFETTQELVEQAVRSLDSRHVVLVKGSRSAAMDRVVRALTTQGGTD